VAVRFNEFDAARLQREAQVAGEAFACDDMPVDEAASSYLSSPAFWMACVVAAGVGAWALGLG
jgi:hypothetical protein